MEALARPETKSLSGFKNKQIIQSKFANFIREIESIETDSEKIKHLHTFSHRISNYLDLDDFYGDFDANYQRNYLARHESGWELLLIAWKKGSKTTIHGHPQLCCYNYIEGEFQ